MPSLDRIGRSCNSVDCQCDHPTVWTFLDVIKRDISKLKALFLQGVTGVAHPAAKVYHTLLERVTRAVESFGRAEILIYLRAMAHLSYT